MNAHKLPMLLVNVDVYEGPLIPTAGLRGHVHAEHLEGEDSLRIVGMEQDMTLKYLGQLDPTITAVIFDPTKYVYVKAIREKSSGQPVTVWVA